MRRQSFLALCVGLLLALALGTSSAMGQDPLVHGLELAGLIALAPIISVMLLGLLVRRKARKEP